MTDRTVYGPPPTESGVITAESGSGLSVQRQFAEPDTFGVVLGVYVTGEPSILMQGQTDSGDGVILEIYPGYAQTDDMILVHDPDGFNTFRVRPSGEVHAKGGVVLYSPNGTGYRLKVSDAGVLSTEAV